LASRDGREKKKDRSKTRRKKKHQVREKKTDEKAPTPKKVSISWRQGKDEKRPASCLYG